MARLGISNTTRVIAYDERGGIYAARLWWILNHYGHANVALLDGGWTKWAAGQAADQHRRARLYARGVQGDAGDGQGRHRGRGQRRDQQRGTKLVDARTQGEIDG